MYIYIYTHIIIIIIIIIIQQQTTNTSKLKFTSGVQRSTDPTSTDQLFIRGALVAEMLARDPQRRPKTADLVQRLERFYIIDKLI